MSREKCKNLQIFLWFDPHNGRELQIYAIAHLLHISKPETGIITAFLFEWHSRGQRFDPAYLHHDVSKKRQKEEVPEHFRSLFFIKKRAMMCAIAHLLHMSI